MQQVPNEAQIIAKTNLATFQYLPSTTSTNDIAKLLTVEQLPAMIVAGHQTAGRGQRSNTWWSGSGSLTCSWVTTSKAEIQSCLPPLAVAVATVEAILITEPELKTKLKVKWPNDIYLNQQKLAGILLESRKHQQKTIVIAGIGINSNCDIRDAPRHLQDTATSLSAVLKRKVDQDNLTIALINQLDSHMAILTRTPNEILDKFKANSLLSTGNVIKFSAADGVQHEGRYAGLGSHGELLVKIGDGVQKFFSATIAEILP
jgi:BirA family biotin operon repressor/biotin-[acetyl-CoA-carboxylase] ligase